MAQEISYLGDGDALDACFGEIEFFRHRLVLLFPMACAEATPMKGYRDGKGKSMRK